jgi:tRNA(Glu) U13 pseudouridine synthase TruD
VQAYIFNRVLFQLLQEKSIEELQNVKIPLVGYDTVLEGELGRRIRKMMRELGISEKSFLLPSMPEMKTTGSYRDAVIKVKDITLLKIFDDGLNPGKKAVQISFTLPPGSYATVVLEKIMKGEIEVFP